MHPTDYPSAANNGAPGSGTTPVFDPLLLLRVLVQHHVRFVIIGGVAARVHGSPTLTADLDLCYERSRTNLEALARALRSVHARLRDWDPGLPFLLDAKTLELGDHFTFSTDAGDLDCLATPTGTTGYPDLDRDAVELELGGIPARIASLDDVIRMKRATGRPKDRIELQVLGGLRDELEQGGGTR